MSKSKTSVPKADELKGFDWATLITKLPALAVLIKQVIDLFMQNSVAFNDQEKDKFKAACRSCPALCDLCDQECDALANLIVAHCKLHAALHADCE